MAIPMRRLMPLLIAMGCVVAGSVLGAVALPAVLARFERQAEPKPETAPRGIPLGEPIELIVNLRDAEGRRVLKATMAFEAKDREAKAALAERMDEIRHHLISLLADKQLEEIEGTKQKDLLLRTIRLTVNERLGIPDAVLHVYFTQFIIQ